MLAAAARGAGHVRRDPVAERLEHIGGRPRAVLTWLRGFAAATEWLAPKVVQDKRGVFLDALANGAGVATIEDAQRWHASGRQVDARRQWARLRMREAWAAWHGRAWMAARLTGSSVPPSVVGVRWSTSLAPGLPHT